jgi:glutamate synthase (NADPH/NADH) small chain
LPRKQFRKGAVISTNSPVKPPKYTWAEVSRVNPAKRPAKDRVKDYEEVYSVFDEATVRAQASRCVECATAFCRTGCPLANRIPEWMHLTAEGRFIEAARLSQSTNTMPEICARVCPQEKQCESMCALNEKCEPVSIGAIEMFINEYAFAHGGVDAKPARPNGMSVAMVGAGPASMACADLLARRGYRVVIYESKPFAGGLLIYGIPAFKLDKSVVDRRVAVLEKRGVIFRTNTTVGRDVTLKQLMETHDAVFLGMGAQKAKPLDVPGANLKGIYDALPFLQEKNLGPESGLPAIPVQGKRVAVLGGGDSAMDCLRSAIRAGALSATCVYRRDFENMPGSRKEYKNAIEEGAEFIFLANPIAIEGDEEGRVKQVRCCRMQLGEPDAKGRRKPYPVPDSEFLVPADVLLVAYGFDPVPFPADTEWGQIAVNDWGGVIVDENQMTSVPGIFCGGDQVRGPLLVSWALVDGRRAAEGIHRYLAARKQAVRQ